jgi:hypothetical protein
MGRNKLAVAVVFALWSSLAVSQQEAMHVDFKTFKTGQQSRIEKFKTFVIRNDAQWREYFFESTGNRPTATAKGIDWSRYELLAIHLGTRTSGGHLVYVGGIERTPKGKIKVSVVEQRPGRGMVATTVMTSPYIIVQIPRHGLPYEFEKALDETSPKNPDPRPIPKDKPTACECCSHDDGTG